MAQVPPLPIGPSAGGVPQLSVETTVQQERDLAQPGVRADEFGQALSADPQFRPARDALDNISNSHP